jgi:hypothetical protein
MANLDGKLKNSGQGHIHELKVCFESMEAINEELCKTI